MECRTERLHGAGDHLIVVGQVLALDATPHAADPLLYFRGAYRRLAPS
jgi:flavin reductase (DIM6/NTAB) family NADH-FMN oxidoreductase RutF